MRITGLGMQAMLLFPAALFPATTLDATFAFDGIRK